MKANFDKWFNRELRALEGGLANLEGDAGGFTVFGIARNFWPDWEGWPIVDKEVAKFKKLNRPVEEYPLFKSLEEPLKTFYREEFWNPIKADSLPSGVDTFIMSAAIHNGIKPAIKILQKTVNTTVDGIIGDKTIDAAYKFIENSDRISLLKSLRVNLEKKYKESPNQKYIKGFLNRASLSYDFAAKIIFE